MYYTIFNFDSTSLCKQQPSIFLHFLNRGIGKKVGLVTEIDTSGIVFLSVSEDKIRVAACFNFIRSFYKTFISFNPATNSHNFFCKRRPLIFREFFDRNIKRKNNSIITDQSSLTFIFTFTNLQQQKA